TSCLKGQLAAGLQHDLLPGFYMQLTAGFAEPCLTDLEMQAAFNDEALVSVGTFTKLAPHAQVLVALDLGDPVALHAQPAVVEDLLAAIMTGEQRQVLLGVQPDLLAVPFILEAQLVEALALVGPGANHRARLVLGQ